MQRSSSILLRITIFIIGLFILGLCLFVLPEGWSDEEAYRPIIAGMYLAALPFFYGLYQALKILGYIDRNQAFSLLSILALKRIKYAAMAITALYAVGLPYFYVRAQHDDAPGLLAIAIIITLASATVALFATLLQKLLGQAVTMKAEQDLTV
ncbi:MAG: hypothetical protein JWN33_510 [Candidatus Saccharibacteria bacterium]|nr:hypothetical protein [Candidatus Saccharibacteria bacterium]